MTQTLVDPALAPLGREPLALGVDYIEITGASGNSFQRYRTEAWRLTSGETVVIVSENGDGMSLLNAADKIETAINARWYTSGPPLEIIEQWGPKTFREQYNQELDLAALDARGIVLPR